MSKASHLILLIASVFLAGCVQAPESLALSNSVVSEFLKQYPDAEVTINFFPKSQMQNLIESARKDCDNPYMEAKDYYRVNIEDNESGLSVLAWIDLNNKSVECAVKKSMKAKVAESKNTTQTTQLPLPQSNETTIGIPSKACPSCDDDNRCTFDYCNEFTNSECRHKDVSPCYNDGVCEDDETDLPSVPSCPNLGWVSAGRVSAGMLAESRAEQGYYDYLKKTNSGQNNDCPSTCGDNNSNTSDYFDFQSKQCKHYDCFAAAPRLAIRVIEPLDGTTVSSRSVSLRLETSEGASCWYALDPYPYDPSGRSALSRMSSTGSTVHSQILSSLYSSNQVYVSCTGVSGDLKTASIIFYYAADYPKWEGSQVSISPSSLGADSSTVETTVATQDNGSPVIPSVTFTLVRPDGTKESKTATGNCAVANHGTYVSRGWKVAFSIQANTLSTPQAYSVYASTSYISSNLSGSFSAAAAEIQNGTDLIIQNMSTIAPGGFSVSRDLNFTVDVMNKGAVSAEGEIEIKADFIGTETNTTIFKCNKAFLPNSVVKCGPYMHTFPYYGLFTARFYADYSSKISELNETNNEYSVQVGIWA